MPNKGWPETPGRMSQLGPHDVSHDRQKDLDSAGPVWCPTTLDEQIRLGGWTKQEIPAGADPPVLKVAPMRSGTANSGSPRYNVADYDGIVNTTNS